MGEDSLQNRKNEINLICSTLRGVLQGEVLVILAIGSAARGTETNRSDIDLLILTESRIGRLKCPAPFHVQYETLANFRVRLSKGDDFAAWAVRYGIPLLSTDVWRMLCSEEVAGTWPSWQRKVSHALRRLMLAYDLLRDGDEEAATEEMLFALSHAGRALLLRAGEFPLSRPELPEQLARLGYPQLSELLKKLLASSTTRRDLEMGVRYAKKVLTFLDTDAYRECVKLRREARMRKVRYA